MQNQKNPWINLKKLREDRGWTQQESADKLGFTRCYVSTVERGKRGISMNMLQQIIKVYKVKYEDFYQDRGGSQ